MSETVTLPPITAPRSNGPLSLRPASRQLQISQRLQLQQPQPHPPVNLPRRLPVIFLDPRRLTSGKSRQRERVDPSLLLNPARKKLSSLESQRIMGVVMETLRRVNLVLALPRAIDSLGTIAHRLERRDLVELLEEHTALLDDLDDLLVVSGVGSRSNSRAPSAESRARSAILESVGPDVESEIPESRSGSMHDGKFDEGISEQDILEEPLVEIQVQEEPLDQTNALEKEVLKENVDQTKALEQEVLEEPVEPVPIDELESKAPEGIEKSKEADLTNKQMGGSKSSSRCGSKSPARIESESADSLKDKFDETDELEQKEEAERRTSSELEAGFLKRECSEQDVLSESGMKEDDREEKWTDENKMNLLQVPGLARRDSLASRLSINQSQLFTRLQDSSRNILRIVAKQPDVVKEMLQYLDDEAGDEEDREKMGVAGARAALEDLKNFAMRKLLTSSYEQTQQEVQMVELEQRIRQSDEVIDGLEGELSAAEAERDSDIKEKNDVIRHLQTELNRIERQSEERIRNMKLEGARNQSAEQSACEERCSVLRQEKNQMMGQYNSLLSTHRDSEMVLRKRKFQIETEIENLIQKYDNDMGEKQDEYDQIDFVYTEEKRQLNELEERFRTLELEYSTITAARHAARAARETAERELHRAVRAATAIQAFWRSHRVRKAMKSRKRRGGTAGGKKKK